MNNQISWQVELQIKPGQLDALRALTREMVESAKGESGTLTYERFISEDSQVVYVLERYIDSTAAVTHLKAFVSTYGERLAKTIDRKQFNVFGTPSVELKEVLDRFGAAYFSPFAGFSRL